MLLPLLVAIHMATLVIWYAVKKNNKSKFGFK